MAVHVGMYMCVGGDPDVIVCLCCPKVLSTHLKEGRKFLQLFLSSRMPLPWLVSKHSPPQLIQGEDFKAVTLKNIPTLTTCRVFQEKGVSLWMLRRSFMSSLDRWGLLLGMKLPCKSFRSKNTKPVLKITPQGHKMRLDYWLFFEFTNEHCRRSNKWQTVALRW